MSHVRSSVVSVVMGNVPTSSSPHQRITAYDIVMGKVRTWLCVVITCICADLVVFLYVCVCSFIDVYVYRVVCSVKLQILSLPAYFLL